ncbi:MAG: HIT family protein [Spirochaetes bacterium]|nr:HIT family protein [Spirochaetota bacterium]
MGADCIFCRIVRGEIPSHRVGETARTLSVLDAFPAAVGHLLILSKDHHERLHEVPEETLAELGREAGRLSRALVEKLGAGAYNLIQNNGRDAGQQIGHVHFHLVPRSPGDGLLPFTSGARRDDAYYNELQKKLTL